MGWDEDEVELEMERARDADRGRESVAVTMGQLLPMRGRAGGVPPQVPVSERLLTCCLCGFASSTHRGWRVDPRARPQGIVCSGRRDETGAAVDCYDKLDRRLADDLGQQVEAQRMSIRAANERARNDRGPRGGGYAP